MLKGKLKWKTKEVKKPEHKVTELSKKSKAEEPAPELPPDFNNDVPKVDESATANTDTIATRDAVSGEKDRKIQKLSEEAEELRKKLKKSKKQVDDISSEKEKLVKANDDLSEKCKDLRERNKSLQDEIDQLREQMKAVSVASPTSKTDSKAPSLPGSAKKTRITAATASSTTMVAQTPIKMGRKRSNSVATKGFI